MSGHLDIGDTLGGVLVGDRHGFSVEIGSAVTGPWHVVFCDGAAGCAPGTVANINHFWVGLDFYAQNATLNGVTYQEVNSLTGDAWVSTGFATSVTLPPLSNSAVLRTPFTMTGLFTLEPEEGPRSDYPLVGSGILTSTWRGDLPGEEGKWFPTALRYDFVGAAPIPEPTTIVLAGIAGAAAAFGRRKRRGR